MTINGQTPQYCSHPVGMEAQLRPPPDKEGLKGPHITKGSATGEFLQFKRDERI
jgi:hypothetical protein